MFSLDDYEDVATLNRWFIENYPMGRIDVDVLQFDAEKGFALIKASAFRDANDVNPAASNVAYGHRDNYNRQMARYFTEDVATSAIGRCIIILKGSAKTATKESMQQVANSAKIIEETKAKMAQTSKTYVPIPKEDDPWTIRDAAPAATVSDAVDMVQGILGGHAVPQCNCGDRVFNSGISPKTRKEWGAYDCPKKGFSGKANACTPDRIWAEIQPNGTWAPQKARS